MRKKSILTGLAGAAALAGASQAYGTLIVRPTPANITGHDPASTTSTTPQNRLIDVDGNGTNDLRISYRSFTTSGYHIQQSFAFSLSVGGGTNAYYDAGSQQWYAYKLAQGDTVPSFGSFGQSASYLTQVCTNVEGYEYAPYWYIGDRGFLGFSFTNAANQIRFGYIEFELDAFGSAVNPTGGIRFFSLAYEDSGAPATIVPEPSTLAALAFGGVGLAAAAFRRRKKS